MKQKIRLKQAGVQVIFCISRTGCCCLVLRCISNIPLFSFHFPGQMISPTLLIILLRLKQTSHLYENKSVQWRFELFSITGSAQSTPHLNLPMCQLLTEKACLISSFYKWFKDPYFHCRLLFLYCIFCSKGTQRKLFILKFLSECLSTP